MHFFSIYNNKSIIAFYLFKMTNLWPALRGVILLTLAYNILYIKTYKLYDLIFYILLISREKLHAAESDAQKVSEGWWHILYMITCYTWDFRTSLKISWVQKLLKGHTFFTKSKFCYRKFCKPASLFFLNSC